MLPTPLCPISVIFMQFFGQKNLPNNRFYPQTQGLVYRLRILDPPLLVVTETLETTGIIRLIYRKNVNKVRIIMMCITQSVI